jgi:hypothetical protein
MLTLDNKILLDLNLPTNIPGLENIADFGIEFDFLPQIISTPHFEEKSENELSSSKQTSFNSSSPEIPNVSVNNSAETINIPSISSPPTSSLQKQSPSNPKILNLHPSSSILPVHSVHSVEQSHSEILLKSNNRSDENQINQTNQSSQSISHLELIHGGMFKLKKLTPLNQIEQPVKNDSNDLASNLAKIAEARSLIEVSLSSESKSESSDSDF